MPSIHSGPRALRQDGARSGANRVIVFLEIKHSRKAFITANRIPRKKSRKVHCNFTNSFCHKAWKLDSPQTKSPRSPLLDAAEDAPHETAFEYRPFATRQVGRRHKHAALDTVVFEESPRRLRHSLPPQTLNSDPRPGHPQRSGDVEEGTGRGPEVSAGRTRPVGGRLRCCCGFSAHFPGFFPPRI